MNSIEPVMAWNLGPDYPRWTETLHDKTRVVIRPVTRQDSTAEREFIEALSPQSRRFRFLGQIRHPSSELIRQFTDIDYNHEVAFAAVVPDDAAYYVVVPQHSTGNPAVVQFIDWLRAIS